MFKLIAATGLAALTLTFQVVAVSQEPSTDPEPVFVRINNITISQSEFEAIFQSAVRHKYYHGKVLEEELAKFRQQVTDDIVTQTLVHDEALASGLKPDSQKINEGIDAFNLKNANNPDWEARREKIIPRLVERLERQDLLEQMEARIRDLPKPGADEVRRYYQENPEKFTEPERLKVSVIVLGVPPAAAEELWNQAETELGALRLRILNGEDFGQLARQYSSHPSAVNGGDIGYLHEGMLDSRVQKHLAALSVSELGEPLRILEGIALFRLDDLQPETLRPFGEVENRAADLLYRESQDAAWQAYVSSLKSAASIYIRQP